MRVTLSTLLLMLLMNAAQALPVCNHLFVAPPAGETIHLLQNPEVLRQVFSKDPKIPSKVSNSKISETLDNIFLKEMNDRLDYQDPKGRYNRVTQEFFKVIPEAEYRQRLETGDLKAISHYVNEISTDALGRPLAEPIFPYKIINDALRTGVATPEVQQQIKDLDIALAKVPSVSGIVYRGTRMDFETANSILTGKQKELATPAFTSTTSDLYDASSFLVKFLGNARKTAMPTFMIIEMTEGKPTSMDTTFAKEEELLIPHGAEFEIVRAYKAPPIRDPESEDILFLFLRQKPKR